MPSVKQAILFFGLAFVGLVAFGAYSISRGDTVWAIFELAASVIAGWLVVRGIRLSRAGR